MLTVYWNAERQRTLCGPTAGLLINIVGPNMSDTDALSTLEIFACTLIGESESLGQSGMLGTACTIVNRARANKKWMGGNDVRNVCLQKGQYDCWWPQSDNADRERILEIAQNNPLYGPYAAAVRIAQDAINGVLVDVTNSAVSYYDSDKCPEPYWTKGKEPCCVDNKRFYFDLATVS